MSDRKTQPPPQGATPMARAHQAPRCSHIKDDGRRCQSPALKGKRLCYFHGRIHYPRPRRTVLPPLEDANSVQAVLLSVQRALLEGSVDLATARLLLYALEIASNNLKNVTFEPLAQKEAPHGARPVGPAESSPGRESRGSSEERALFHSAEEPALSGSRMGPRAGRRPERA